MADILYTSGDGLYVNLTNRCPCNCVFCIRKNAPGVGSADSLWHEADPSLAEVLAAFEEVQLSSYSELVFCGYGEPMEALDTLLAVCRYVREISDIPIRINTNGLADLIHGRPTAALLYGLVDTVSISLNAPDQETYLAVTRPSFGLCAFDAMIRYAVQCKEVVPHVVFTVVNTISAEQIARSRELAEKCGIPLRVRNYSDDRRTEGSPQKEM